MTVWLPTTTVDVFRDSTTTSDTDVFGDETDSTQVRPVLFGVPVSVSQSNETRSLPADLRSDEVRTFTIRVARRYGIKETDRLCDTQTGEWYMVRMVSNAQFVVGVTPSRLVCTKVGSAE